MLQQQDRVHCKKLRQLKTPKPHPIYRLFRRSGLQSGFLQRLDFCGANLQLAPRSWPSVTCATYRVPCGLRAPSWESTGGSSEESPCIKSSFPTAEIAKIAQKRVANSERRSREHLTLTELERLIRASAGVGRHGPVTQRSSR